jgi:hypothetical protein
MAWLKSTALMLAAFVLLLLVKAGLSLMPYRRLVRFLPPPGKSRPDGWVKTRTARALHRAAHWLPSATCLPQALAGNAMLSLQGYESRIRIGVAASPGRRLRAHAWLLCGDDVLIGDSENLTEFVTMTDLRGGRP